MSKNKMSLWAVIILVATIISLALLVTSIAVTAVAIPVALQTAKDAAMAEGGITPEEADLVAGIAIAVMIVALVLSSVFDVLKIIGGFMFSLKGRWGIFCIIVSILSFASGIFALVNDIRNYAGVGTIVVSSLSLAVSAILVLACFKHRAEIQ